MTVLLGSSLAVDVTALSSLSNPKNLTLLSLIVGTYLLTILYAVGLRYVSNLRLLAYLQIAGDTLITAILVTATGGLDSLFVFLFYLNIINAAVVTGRKAAAATATATAGAFIFLALAAWEVIELPGMEAMRTARSLGDLIYEVGINSVAAYLVAVLAGYLAQRLGEVTGELERQQSNVQELRALNANILASLNSGLLTVDSGGAVIFFNRAAETITGRSAAEVYGKRLDDVFPSLAGRLAQAGGALESDAQTFASESKIGHESRLESIYVRPNGEQVYLGFSVSLLRDSQDQVAGRIVIFQDLSEVKKLEREKKRSERLAAVGQLAAAIAHEIRNPLASISGSVEMLESISDLDEDDAMLMRIIVREVDRLDKLITSFLDYSRPRTLERTRTDLIELIRDVLGLFRNRPASQMVPAHLAADDDLEEAPAQVDREALRQVMWNLLNNAREAMEENQAGGQIRVSVSRHGNRWVVVVEDDGPGISAELSERIFEPFFTTKETGTGLGLATIHRLIEQHDGKIHVGRAQHLSGARFEVELPADFDAPPPNQDSLNHPTPTMIEP
uniref:two-component system sensor histidine kinase NtrB n=1 Tax=Persicimonas caeni TaxID=2292766 RepID=UPI00143D015B|nr:ATP-binding protein [Persicimonas caeni]